MCEDQVAVLSRKKQTLDTGKVERPDTNVRENDLMQRQDCKLDS